MFNTSMTGYQEILTDPSYCRQIVTLTYPHIGNTGANPEDVESGNIDRVYAAGLVIRNLPPASSNWRQTRTLPEYLKQQGVVAIADIDTRKLTRILREKGAQAGCIMAGFADETEALKQARAFPGLVGMDLAKVVSCAEPYEWNEGEWKLGHGFQTRENPSLSCRCAGFWNQAQYASEIGAAQLQGYCFSRTDRSGRDSGITVRMVSSFPTDRAIPSLVIMLLPQPGNCSTKALPIFGVCMGHQLLGLASGASTIKMKFGHHGANHPVQDLDSGKILITSQNHGFAVDIDTLPSECDVLPICHYLTGACRDLSWPASMPSAFKGILKRVLALTISTIYSTNSSD